MGQAGMGIAVEPAELPRHGKTKRGQKQGRRGGTARPGEGGGEWLPLSGITCCHCKQRWEEMPEGGSHIPLLPLIDSSQSNK